MKLKHLFLSGLLLLGAAACNDDNDAPVFPEDPVYDMSGFAKGALYVNQAAAELLLSDQVVSLLPVGVIAVKGQFNKDDIVHIVAPGNQVIGVGKSSYSSNQISELMGKHDQKPVVHYDYLYIE